MSAREVLIDLLEEAGIEVPQAMHIIGLRSRNDVNVGEDAEITHTFDFDFLPLALRVGPSVSPDFEILRMQIGKRDIVYGNPVTCEIFETDQRFTPFGSCEKGERFAMHVRNIGGTPRLFRGALIGTYRK